MSVNQSYSPLSIFVGDGHTVVFNGSTAGYNSDTTVVVYLGGVIQSSGYTVSGTSNAVVTFTNAPSDGEEVIIAYEPKYGQDTQLPNGSPFHAKTIEDSLDKLAYQNIYQKSLSKMEKVSIGTVEVSGTTSSVTAKRTSSGTQFNFVLQKGATGPAGATGATGQQGPAGATGAQGPAGPANTLSIGTVVSGSTASASITGTAPSQTLNLTLPKGDTGDTGATGPQGPAGAQGTPGEDGEDGKSEIALPVTSVTQQIGTEEYLVAKYTDQGLATEYTLYFRGDLGPSYAYRYSWADNSYNSGHSSSRTPSVGDSLFDDPYGVMEIYKVKQYSPGSQGSGTALTVVAGNAYRWTLTQGAAVPGELTFVPVANVRSVIPLHLEFSQGTTPSINGTGVTIPQTLESGDYEVYYDGVSAAAVLRKAGASSGGSASWGSISGTLSSQTDLQTALDAKQGTLTAGGGVTITGDTISASVQDVQLDGQSVVSGGTATIPDNRWIKVAGGTFTGAVSGTSITVSGQYRNCITTIPSATSAHTLTEGVSTHAPSAPATYTLPNITDSTVTHEVVLYLDCTTTASFVFKDSDGNDIVPDLVGTPAVGEKWVILCSYSPTATAWKVIGYKEA